VTFLDRQRTPVVAAFDFDGTLSTRDNFVPFLRYVAGPVAVANAVTAGTVRVGAQGRPSWSRDALKAQVLARLFAGRSARRVDDLGHAFADDIVRNHLRSEAVEQADWHRTQGHVLVIVSASLGVYLRPVAQRLRFDTVLCSELEVGDDDRLTGRLVGPNVRGAEKPRRLDEWLAGEPAYVWAYGDSSGDRMLWARADRAVRVGRTRRIAVRPPDRVTAARHEH
jgi:HAD superfamily hydrolase (TIGR01490 family)